MNQEKNKIIKHVNPDDFNDVAKIASCEDNTIDNVFIEKYAADYDELNECDLLTINEDEKSYVSNKKYHICPVCHNKTLIEVPEVDSDYYICDECGAEGYGYSDYNGNIVIKESTKKTDVIDTSSLTEDIDETVINLIKEADKLADDLYNRPDDKSPCDILTDAGFDEVGDHFLIKTITENDTEYRIVFNFTRYNATYGAAPVEYYVTVDGKIPSGYTTSKTYIEKEDDKDDDFVEAFSTTFDETNSISEKYENPKEMEKGYSTPLLHDANWTKDIEQCSEMLKDADTNAQEAAKNRLIKIHQEILDNLDDFDEFDSYWKEKYQEAKRLLKSYLDDIPVEIKKLASNESLEKDVKPASLTEASYGGAYDIVDDQYFTKDDLNEFIDDVLEAVDEHFGVRNFTEIYDADITNGIISLTLSFKGYEESYSTKIDMRKIKVPRDLIKHYSNEFIKYFIDKFEEAIDNDYIDFKQTASSTK